MNGLQLLKFTIFITNNVATLPGSQWFFCMVGLVAAATPTNDDFLTLYTIASYC
jgi:hypothetical protein